MKKNNSITATSLYVVGLIVLFGLTDCKKSSVGHTASDNTFSFSYNGTQYVLPPFKDEYSVDSTMIGITRLDIFAATINYRIPDCAYYVTDNSMINVSGNCQLTTGSGLPIDSVAVYIYQSGSMNVAYSNCSTESLIDFSGNHVTAQYCDMEGSFNLVLKNSENKLITISDGHFIQYHMTRSWKIR